MTTRNELAAAASSVPGYHVTPHYRQTTKPGDGFVSLGRVEQDGSGIGYVNIWQILIVLGGDLRAAEDRLDADLDALINALSPHMYLTQIQPAQVTYESLTLSALMIEGVTERE